jgi:hypothetical protein
LFGIFFDPEDAGDIFLRNVGCLSTDHTALVSRKIPLSITTAVRTADFTGYEPLGSLDDTGFLDQLNCSVLLRKDSASA